LTHDGANVVVEPSPEGATGSAYLLRVNFAQGGKLSGGTYRDVIVRTPEGWRFRQRIYVEVPIASATGAGSAAAPR
jgi:hypothetical protein